MQCTMEIGLETLIEYGFRLPSALDNRPMRFKEFENSVNQIIYVSATPSDYELDKSKGVFVEQIMEANWIIRPTNFCKKNKRSDCGYGKRNKKNHTK